MAEEILILATFGNTNPIYGFYAFDPPHNIYYNVENFVGNGILSSLGFYTQNSNYIVRMAIYKLFSVNLYTFLCGTEEVNSVGNTWNIAKLTREVKIDTSSYLLCLRHSTISPFNLPVSNNAGGMYMEYPAEQDWPESIESSEYSSYKRLLIGNYAPLKSSNPLPIFYK